MTFKRIKTKDNQGHTQNNQDISKYRNNQDIQVNGYKQQHTQGYKQLNKIKTRKQTISTYSRK